MSRVKLLLENFLVYGLGNALGNLIPFLLLPVLTRSIPDPAVLGSFDTLKTVVLLGSTIAGLGLFDALFRLYFDKSEHEDHVRLCSTALVLVVLGGLISGIGACFVLRFIPQHTFPIGGDKYLVLLIGVSIFLSSMLSIVAAPFRMRNKRVAAIVNGLIIATGTYGFALLSIRIFGVSLFTLPCSYLLSLTLSIVMCLLKNRTFFNLKKFTRVDAMALLKLGIPMMPAILMYWTLSSFPLLLVAHRLGTEAAGIYGIANKVASISQFIYAAFSGGWLYYSYSTMRESDQVSSVSNTFKYLILIVCVFLCLVLPIYKFFFQAVFPLPYSGAYSIFPYLFMCPLVLMMYQAIASQFVIAKQPIHSTIILTCAVILNIVLSLLTSKLNLIKIALLSLSSFVFVVFVSSILLSRRNLLVLEKKAFISICIIVLLLISNHVFDADMIANTFAGSLALLALTFTFQSELIGMIHYGWKKFAKASETN